MRRILSALSCLLSCLVLPVPFAQAPTPLLEPADLAARLKQPNVRVIDIREGRTAQGRTLYDAGHIPGAVDAPYRFWRGPETAPGRMRDRDYLGELVQRLSVSVVFGAFVFGAAMQVTDGCGSGTLYKAGLGNVISIAVLPGFIAGSFIGAAHLDWWLRLGDLGPMTVQQFVGTAPALLLQLAVFAALSLLVWRKRKEINTRWHGRGIFVAAIVLAAFAIADLVVAGQPWGIVYGLGLWGAKVATALGWDPSTNAYWGRAPQLAQIAAPLIDDVTSITNLGLLLGCLVVALWRGHAFPAASPTPTQWVASIVTGLVLGYSARLAFGCNIGAYFSGISSGSLHGWVWFACAFVGSVVGIRLRERLGFKG